jgi:membrane-associated phospholipid phosphatase
VVSANCMTTKNLVYLALSLVIGSVFCIWLVDQPLAFFNDHNLRGSGPGFNAITTAGELITGFPVSKYLPAFVLVLAGAGMLAVDRRFTRAKFFFYVGLTFFLTRLIAGVLKTVFERMRPFELVATQHHGNTFFVDGGSSFPSGHAAHFWGLFFPLVLIFPGLRVPLSIVPVAICIARVAVNDHYLSDVIASALLAILVAVGLAKLFRVQQKAVEKLRY